MMKYRTEIKQHPISGIEEIDLFELNRYSESNCEFVIIYDKNTEEPILNLKVESDYSVTFSQTDSVNNLIIIGYGNRFAIFDLESKSKKYETCFNGYFSSFKIYNHEVFLASDSDLIRISLSGELIWTAEYLGIDGVEILEINEEEIKGKGEYNPPGGWESFIIDRNTGKVK